MIASRYTSALDHLRASPHRWAITGGAGFIGSHLVETLLWHDQEVVVLDDFSTGREDNLEILRAELGAQAERLVVVKGDIRGRETCLSALRGAQFVLHQGGSGPFPDRSRTPSGLTT